MATAAGFGAGGSGCASSYASLSSCGGLLAVSATAPDPAPTPSRQTTAAAAAATPNHAVTSAVASSTAAMLPGVSSPLFTALPPRPSILAPGATAAAASEAPMPAAAAAATAAGGVAPATTTVSSGDVALAVSGGEAADDAMAVDDDDAMNGGEVEGGAHASADGRGEGAASPSFASFCKPSGRLPRQPRVRPREAHHALAVARCRLSAGHGCGRGRRRDALWFSDEEWAGCGRWARAAQF